MGPIFSNDMRNFLSIAMTLQKTTARGDVSIKARDTAGNPLVNTNWLGTPADQQLAIQGMKRAREIIRGLEETVVGGEVAPGAAVQTDAQILEYMRNTVVTIHHASTTCEFFPPRGILRIGRSMILLARLRRFNCNAKKYSGLGQVFVGAAGLAGKMGQATDPTAVVDDHCRVLGGFAF